VLVFVFVVRFLVCCGFGCPLFFVLYLCRSVCFAGTLFSFRNVAGLCGAGVFPRVTWGCDCFFSSCYFSFLDVCCFVFCLWGVWRSRVSDLLGVGFVFLSLTRLGFFSLFCFCGVVRPLAWCGGLVSVSALGWM